MKARPTRSHGIRKAFIAGLVVGLILVFPIGAAQAASKAKRAAKRDAIHRLETAPLRSQTHAVSRLPASLGLNEAPFAPATPNLVDEHALFVTTLGPSQAFAWFKSHPPPQAGAQRLISTGAKPSSRVLGFIWGDSRVKERALYVTLIGRARGSAIRIDAQATWGDAGEIAG
jgi:hypothetical protein